MSCKIVLVGGPANNRKVALPDYAPEYKVLLPPRNARALVLDSSVPPEPLEPRVGVYRRAEPVRSRHVMGEPLPYIYAGEEK